jgi:hypothetical protein
MKKLFAILFAGAGLTLTACAQKLDAAKVPAAVKQTFIKQYPGATAKWEKEDGKYEANFTQKGNTMSALFEPGGTMTESEMEIKTSALPAAATTFIKDHYKGVNVKGAAKITKASGEVNYEAEIKGKDVMFDANGKFIKEQKD